MISFRRSKLWRKTTSIMNSVSKHLTNTSLFRASSTNIRDNHQLSVSNSSQFRWTRPAPIFTNQSSDRQWNRNSPHSLGSAKCTKHSGKITNSVWIGNKNQWIVVGINNFAKVSMKRFRHALKKKSLIQFTLGTSRLDAAHPVLSPGKKYMHSNPKR